jgi:hypothetical protein
MTYSSSDFHSDLVAAFDERGLIPGLDSDAEDNAAEEGALCIAALDKLISERNEAISALQEFLGAMDDGSDEPTLVRARAAANP